MGSLVNVIFDLPTQKFFKQILLKGLSRSSVSYADTKTFLPRRMVSVWGRAIRFSNLDYFVKLKVLKLFVFILTQLTVPISPID